MKDAIMMSIPAYLEKMKNAILSPESFQSIEISTAWLSNFKGMEAGVYVLKDRVTEKLLYVGETGNLELRMKDLLKTMNHSVRRTLGKRLFESESGFSDASAQKKFPERIEKLLNQHMEDNILVSVLPVSIGRKELEEAICEEIDVSIKLNKRSKRKK